MKKLICYNNGKKKKERIVILRKYENVQENIFDHRFERNNDARIKIKMSNK
jgi:hypothetical protein